MKPAPVSPSGFPIAECFFQIGIFGPIFVIVAIILAGWLLYLAFRPRPRSDYFACLAATFYPACLGLLSASFSMVQVYYELGYFGRLDHAGPGAIANAIAQLLSRLLVGTSMSCVFVPLGLLVLLVRKPK